MPIDPHFLVPPSERVATDAFRGYVYQCYLAVERWVNLTPIEVLFCEGWEDLDVYLLGGRPDESGEGEQPVDSVDLTQVKDYQTFGTSSVREVLANFLESFRKLSEAEVRGKFTLVTTAPSPKSRRKTLIDFLDQWEEGEKIEVIRDGVRTLLEGLGSKTKAQRERRERVFDALDWLDEDLARWEHFRWSVYWKFGAPDVEEVIENIKAALFVDDMSLTPDQTESLADRLLVDVVRAHRENDPAKRVRTAADLTAKLRKYKDELVAWSASPLARRVRELRETQSLLDTEILAPPERTAKDRDSWARLLTASYEIVPFETERRRVELDLLEELCDSDERIEVLLLYGEGGVGKTRLMIEVCQRLKADGWIAGFLPRVLQDTMDPVDELLRGERPRLVVRDYADARLPRLKNFLRSIAPQKDTGGPKLRVVLLSRNRGDWWTQLAQDDEYEIAVGDLLRRREPHRMSDLPAEPEQRAGLFHRAAEAFGRFLEIDVDGEWEIPDLSPPDDPEEEDLFARLLYIHMAALAWLDGSEIEGASDALRHVLAHERRFWREQVDGEISGEPKLGSLKEKLPQAVAAFTLTDGALDVDSALGVLDRFGWSLDDREYVCRLLHRLYPSPEESEEGWTRYVMPLTPDLLGEELVAKVFGERPGLLHRLVDEMTDEEAEHCLTVLTRLAQRDAERGVPLIRSVLKGRIDRLARVAFEAALAVGDPLGRVMVEVVPQASEETLEWLGAQMDQAGDHLSVALRELAVAVLEARLEAHDNEGPAEQAQAERARILNNLGGRYNALGRWEDALPVTEEAVEIRRDLAEQRPDAFRPDLANSLNNLGVDYDALGQREDALQVTEEAVEIYRDLTRQRPDAFRPDLARSLNNLGIRYDALGRREDALQVTEEAVEIYRDLAEQRPDAFRPDLAMSLDNLGIRYNALGRREDARRVTEEAVEIRRDLAEQRPDAFRPDLAVSLNNLGECLYGLQRFELALATIDECIEIWRELAAARPDAFLHELPDSLWIRCLILRDLNRHDEAIQSIEEAIRIATPFVLRLPQAFGGRFVAMMNVYACTTRESDARVDPAVLEPVAEFLEAERWSEDEVECPEDGAEG